jgi:hypothetical protein
MRAPQAFLPRAVFACGTGYGTAKTAHLSRVDWFETRTVLDSPPLQTGHRPLYK